MASLLDFFNGTATPEQNAGLLGFAAQFNGALGDGSRPVNLGQALAAGAAGMQRGRDNYTMTQREKEMLRLQAQLLGYKVKDAESDVQNQDALRKRAEDLRQFYINRGKGAQGSLATGVGQEAAGMGQPAQGQGGVQPAQVGGGGGSSLYQQRLAEAQELRAAGYGPEADAAEAAALKFQPKVKDWKQVTVGGKVMFAPYFEDGTPGQPVPYEAAVELARANTGGTTDLYNPMTGETVRSLRNTVSPDAQLSANVTMRGQNMVDARAAASAPANKPLPASALKMQQNEIDALTTASGINADLGRIEKQINDGKLSFGPVSNLLNKGLNSAGLSTEESRNFASFQATLEKLRNDSLRLNAGVQTDGDAQRAWNELFANINDKGVVKQRLGEIRNINERAMQLRKLNIDGIRANYGHEPLDMSRYDRATQTQAQANGGGKTISLADIAATAKATGKSTAEVTAAARARGYNIEGK